MNRLVGGHLRVTSVAFGVISLLVAACAPVTAPVTAPSEESAAPGGEIVVYVNVGETGLYERLVTPFVQEQFGGTVLYQEKNGLEQVTALMAQKDNPEASLACSVVGGELAAGIEQGVYAPIDYSRLPNSEVLFDFATAAPWGEYGMALYASGIMLQYYTPVFEENNWDPPKTLADLADPKYAGHVGLTSTRSGIGVMFLDIISKAAGAERGDVDPGIAYAKNLVATGQVHSFPGRSSEVNELMERGEIWIATQSGPGGMRFASEGGPVALVVPEDGALILTQGCVIPANAPNPDLAYEILNYVLGEEFQTAVATDLFSDPVRPITLPDELGAMIPHTAEQYAALGEPDNSEWTEFRAAWHERWLSEVEGGS